MQRQKGWERASGEIKACENIRGEEMYGGAHCRDDRMRRPSQRCRDGGLVRAESGLLRDHL